MPSVLVNRNLKVNGRRTSMSFEPFVWECLAEMGRRESLSALISLIEARHIALFGKCSNLASVVRICVVAYFRAAATDAGHRDAGHGLGEPLAGTPLQCEELVSVNGESPPAAPTPNSQLAA